MARYVSESLSCPICFEIPEAEVYQCENEHWLCSRCYFQINPPLCPGCRIRLDRDCPRRCRTIERVLEGLKVDCVFKSSGCDKKLSRVAAQGHRAECIFNFDKFGRFVNLCKSIGYPYCEFKFNNGNTREAVEHFVSKHGCILTTSEKFQMELTSFKESAKAGGSGFHFWTPIIVDLKERKCYLLTMAVLNKADAAFTWLSIYLPYPNNEHRESSPVEIEYKVKTNRTLSLKVWVERPMSLKKANELLPNKIAFVNYAHSFVQGCSEEGNLLMNCYTRPPGGAVSTGSYFIQTFICTRNNKSFSFVDNIQPLKPKVPVRFNRKGGSSAAKSFHKNIMDNWKSTNQLSLSTGNLFERNKPAGLTQVDVEWLKTDLIFATAEHGSVEDLNYLIKQGVNFNVVDKIGVTPLQYTTRDTDKKKTLEKAMLLVDSGLADVHALNDVNRNVLHYAAMFGSKEAVEYFLRKGCSVNFQADNGWTPLHCAVSRINEEEGLKIAKSLLANGAELNIKNKRGNTALDIATKENKTKIAQLLRSHQSNK